MEDTGCSTSAAIPVWSTCTMNGCSSFNCHRVSRCVQIQQLCKTSPQSCAKYLCSMCACCSTCSPIVSFKHMKCRYYFRMLKCAVAPVLDAANLLRRAASTDMPSMTRNTSRTTGARRRDSSLSPGCLTMRRPTGQCLTAAALKRLTTVRCFKQYQLSHMSVLLRCACKTLSVFRTDARAVKLKGNGQCVLLTNHWQHQQPYRPPRSSSDCDGPAYTQQMSIIAD